MAHVGAYEAEAREQGRRVQTVTIPLSDVDRAVVDDERDGFVRVHHERGRLLGCTIVAAHAGEMIGEATYALTHNGTLSAWGVPFGAALWLAADEVEVPAFGLSKSPFEYPLSSHAGQ